MGADKNESERMKVKMKTKEKGNENKRNTTRAQDAARRSNKKSNKMQFVKINRLVHKLTNSDELADKGLH